MFQSVPNLSRIAPLCTSMGTPVVQGPVLLSRRMCQSRWWCTANEPLSRYKSTMTPSCVSQRHEYNKSTLLTPSCVSHSQRRYLQNLQSIKEEFKSRFKPRHEQDGVDPESELIYVNGKHNFGVLASAALLSSLPVSGVLGYRFYKYWDDLDKINIDHPLAWHIALVCIMVPLCTVAYSYSHRFLLRIYYQRASEQYIGVVRNSLLVKSQFSFQVKDVTTFPCPENNGSPLDIYRLLTYTNIEVHGVKFCVAAKDFISSAHYNALMGYV
jgi:hypothetical protein